MIGSIELTTAQRRPLTLALVLCLANAGAALADETGGEVVSITREAAEPAEEPEESRRYTPIQLSLFPPAQVFSRDRTVTGLALNLMYGEQWAVWGLDIGLLNDIGSDLRGLQAGVYSQVAGRGWGAQFGAGSVATGDFTGLQAGLYDSIEEAGRGLQLGIVNQAKTMTGLQLGVVNVATSLRGLQIGLVNVHSDGKVAFLPLFNFGF